MKEGLQIKDKVLGEGKPLICVPVMEQEKDEIVAEVKRLIEEGAKMLEWRVDAFAGISCIDSIREVLEELKPLVQNTILLFTFRSKEQGGLLSLPYENIYELHQVAAESKAVDLIDVEFFQWGNREKEIDELQNVGAKVVASHHNFHETPTSEELFMLLEQMQHSRADIVKLAVMPRDTEDVLRLLETTNRFHKTYPEQPLITMSMGKLGCVSRISGEIFGSCVTFGAGKNASAPGQIPMKELQLILDTLNG